MNCLTEALGLSQPGNGSLLATHADRKQLFLTAGQRIVELTKRYYEQDDASVLPRNIANKAAFENAIALDIAMGGSTNTVLHLLAAAQEGEVEFDMTDIDRMSRQVPHLCKVAPSTQKYHMEDVHRAGGVMGILGELQRAGLLKDQTRTVLGISLQEQLAQYDVKQPKIQRYILCSALALPAFAPLKLSHKIAVGIRSMTIAKRGVFAIKRTHSVKMVALPYSKATWRLTAAS